MSLAAARKVASGLNARVCVVLGSQWGDEGKGKLTDMLAKKCAACYAVKSAC